MKVMNGLVIALEEDKIFMCLAVLLCEQRTEVPRYRSSQSYFMRSLFFVSVYSAAVKC